MFTSGMVGASTPPTTKQIGIAAPWPFSQWKIDILSPFPQTTNKRKYVIVVVEYFSKWPKAKAVRSITSQQMIDFIWRNIVCRFGIPRTLISDKTRVMDRV